MSNSCSDDRIITGPIAFLIVSAALIGVTWLMWQQYIFDQAPIVYTREGPVPDGRIVAKCIVNPDGTATLHLIPGRKRRVLK